MPGTMLFSGLIPQHLVTHRQGPGDCEVSGLAYDSRQVSAGTAFFALRGTAVDGHAFIADVLARGALAVVSEEAVALPEGIAGCVVGDSRLALALAATRYYSAPPAGTPVVGITGTNGKTTVSYLVEAILQAAGRSPALFGTISYRHGDQSLPASHTTPESLDLLRQISAFCNDGADSLVMEVSSHALVQHRVDGIPFSVGVFTNLTPEHLDYHGDMAHYFAGKRRLFSELLARHGGRPVFNLDDPYGLRLAEEFPTGIGCSSRPGVGAVHPRHVTVDLDGIHGELQTPQGVLRIDSPLLGPFNLQNILCAAAAGLALDLAPDAIAQGLSACPTVPGRLERVANRLGALALVDYAHTGDALEKVLTAVAELAPRRVITLFGCGGDRDRTKRPVMGEVAARASNLVILTSDNPRTEDPLAILAEIRPGVLKVTDRELTLAAAAAGEEGFLTIPDRRAAIDFAVSLLVAGDLLLVAGKGHEDYQIVGRQKFHFDDREELARALRQREEEG
ncbi:UDP-N-acetylmuramoyl-L-alanyl-D-glutamate--2,6-diaminopimelate ligase [Desulfuromonas sp. DDH964]|uniref:UDP-N-acetylmuramoyl-L-alanyl-D-glutamate--2, 6-diaminopimelate ligase n=1 Tax=Desulfuromonas sp. DDH964 TaxID=1823759 RepID=UPI00078D8786|nr:UDP-N-acetylmuramoyl-L-alanyl-D-glutamate--2,6-diaminopimelate ligase [Desulfuromonas sp. DDH964]AMV73115.1 UDP-N-acetylmuramoylalanyl-D-glutamate--2, 6-diaminopimelate ligase [Desulfuromonas sp. DDH964]